MRAGKHQHFFASWLPQPGKFAQRFFGFIQRQLHHRLQIVLEDVVRHFRYIPQLLGALKRHDTAHSRDAEQRIVGSIHDLLWLESYLLFQRLKGGGAMLVIGEVEHVFQQNQFPGITRQWSRRLAVVPLQLRDYLGKSGCRHFIFRRAGIRRWWHSRPR